VPELPVTWYVPGRLNPERPTLAAYLRMASMATSSSLGALIASFLSQSWRMHPPSSQISDEELASIIPLLTGSGASALAWIRIRDSHLRDSASALELQQAHRLHAVHAAAFEEDIAKVISLLRTAGVEPILAKGWAVARLYPDTSLRPYGDIDLYVRPREYSSAADVLASAEGKKFVVDLHERFDASDGLSIDDLYERSQLVSVGDVKVRVPCHEDHLRILCLHFLRHGAWRPLWLCDIGAVVEVRPPEFDWDICLGNNARRADWIACSIGLAHQLLGAEIEDTPVADRAKTLPGWLTSNVLKQWETPYSMSQPPVTHAAPMAKYLRDPRGLLADLRRRWPSPIEATVYTGGPFNELPRWPFQIGECVARTVKFLTGLR
jgi:hypothetical protein